MSVKTMKKDLERLHEARTTASDRIATIEERLEMIAEMLTEARIRDEGESDDADELREEQRELERELREMRAVLPAIDDRIDRAQTALHAEAIDQRVTKIRKTAGGLTGEHPRHVERAEEAEQKARDARRKADEAVARSHGLRWAADALGRLLGVDTGEISTVSGVRPPRSSIKRYIGLGKLRQAGEETLKMLDAEDLLTDEAKDAIEAAMDELDAAEENRRHAEEQQARRDEQARERREAMDTVDAWLRDLLADGPVERERVVRAARQAGFPIQRSPHEASLYDARKRLDVDAIERIEDPERPRRSWFVLPGTEWDPEEFRPVRAGSEIPLSAFR